MSPSELMQAMMDAGAPMEAILIAMRALDERDAAIAARRAVERDRKRKQRGTVTGQSRDKDGTVTGTPSPLLPPLKVSPDPFKITPPISPQPILSADADSPPLVPVEPELRPEHVVEAWNDLAAKHGLSQARLTPQRRAKIKTRIRQCSVEEFTEAISAFDRSSFLRGDNDRGWKPNIDWMLEPRNFTKLQEGTYDR